MFLGDQFTRMVRKINGLPGDIQEYMVRAIKGAIDYIMTDIAPGGEQVQDFLEILPQFSENVGKVMRELLKEMGYDKNLIEQMIEEVYHQMTNIEGPDFESLVYHQAMLTMDDEEKRRIMGAVRDSIVEGTM
jgi:hypothetical protein